MATEQQTTSRLAADLRDAFAALAHANVDEGTRSRLHRRLVKITNMGRHDVAQAEARLDRWRADLDAATG